MADKNTAKVRDQHALQDKDLKLTDLALPTDNALDYTANDIDLGFALPNSKDARLEDTWVNIVIPPLTVALLANGATIKVNIYAGTAASPTTEIIGSAVILTGVTAVDPSLKVSRNVKLPADCARYVRAGVICSTSSAKSGIDISVGLVF